MEVPLVVIKLHILKVDQGRVLTTGRPSVLHSWVDGSRKLQIGEILEEKEESNMSEEELKKKSRMTGIQEFGANWLAVSWTMQDLFSN